MVIAPLVVIAAPLLIGLMPLLLLVIIIVASFIPRRFRWPRALLIALVYLLWDALLLLVLFALWIATGFGWKIRSSWSIRAHYAVAALALRVLFWVCRGVLRVRVLTEGAQQTDDSTTAASFRQMLRPGTPVIVASRHAGPGDSFVLMHALLNHVKRMPRVVVKDTLQWDPAIDVLLNRLPSRFISPTGFTPPTGGSARSVQRPANAHVAEKAITELVDGLGTADAFVIFPEGGNFTPSRRITRIDRLRESGKEALALRAEALQHVLAPQPRGLYAAIEAAPLADVVFIAHSGLDDLSSVRDLWRALPMEKRITLHAWRVPRADVPVARDDQMVWLYDWFTRIDGWIDRGSHPAPKSGPQAAQEQEQTAQSDDAAQE
ncbi:1-acyl-sn-glycerol-3-phosphate acyltransferase [Microbacterium lacus]|uniref:1-acyl-sn-glycerol-3-phosphate acyltransferase n=1 Tax=Microbacterium lacus TaxID=415217 RepID=UPI00384CB06B